jgi:hypothetical protein
MLKTYDLTQQTHCQSFFPSLPLRYALNLMLKWYRLQTFFGCYPVQTVAAASQAGTLTGCLNPTLSLFLI